MRKLTIILMVLVCFVAGVSVADYVLAAPIGLPFGHKAVEHLPNIEVSQEDADWEGVSKGVAGFRSIAEIVGKYISLVLGSIALLMLFVAGYQLVTAQGTISEEKEKQKMNVVYIMLGLIVFGLAGDLIYDFVFFDEGEFLLEKESAKEVARDTVEWMRNLLNLFLSFSGAGAILMLVITSMRLIINPGNEDQIEQQKKVVGYTAVGIIIIGLADNLVNRILFPSGGFEGVQVELLNIELRGLSNYVLGFLGAIVFVSFVISGVMIILNYGNEEVMTKVKTTLKNVVIGCLLSFSAYTIVATLLATFLAG